MGKKLLKWQAFNKNEIKWIFQASSKDRELKDAVGENDVAFN